MLLVRSFANLARGTRGPHIIHNIGVRAQCAVLSQMRVSRTIFTDLRLAHNGVAWVAATLIGAGDACVLVAASTSIGSTDIEFWT